MLPDDTDDTDAPAVTAVGTVAIAGVVLAAGAGTRYGRPKALVRAADGMPWLVRTVETLRAAGCSPVLVVLGAEAAEAEALLASYAPSPTSASALASASASASAQQSAPVLVVRADAWAEGLSASLRAALDAAARLTPLPAALAVAPVDVPDLNSATVRRLLQAPGARSGQASRLRQAVFGGRPGHPVLIGQEHWAPLRQTLTGDVGARGYLAAAGAEQVECGDLSTGLDVDAPPV